MRRFLAMVIGLATAASVATLVAAQDRNGGTGSADSKTGAARDNGVVNVYTSRHYDSDQLLYEEFTRKTGITVKRVELKPELLIERVRAEGKSSPADVIIMADAGALWRAEVAGLLQPLRNAAIEQRVPAEYRAGDGRWFGFSRRARVIAYDRAKVRSEEVATYAQLADPRFKGKLCVRSSDNVYNQSILGAFIETWGTEKAAEWARGIVANMARPPQGGDTDQIKAVAAGVCEVALVNTYYYLRFTRSDAPANKALVEKIAISFPEQLGEGTHVNISGGGMAAHAPNPANAIKFLEFLASEKGQELFATANDEYPIITTATSGLTGGVDAGFKAASVPVTVYGKRQAEAQAIFDRVGWR